MRTVSPRLLLAFVALSPLALTAQTTTAAPEPFRILTVYREVVKPGMNVAHDAHENGWARANITAKSPTPMLAVSAMSGVNENWYMSAYQDWAAFEAAQAAVTTTPALRAVQDQYSAKEVDYLSDARMMVLTRRTDLSYGPGADLAKSRYFTVTRILLRPGHTQEWEENRKMVKAAHEAAHLSDSFTVWQAARGAPAGTFFIIVAHRTLAELDSGAIIHNDAYRTALGGPDGQKKMNDNAAASIVNSEVNNFRFEPSQSIPPAEWVAADPKFWKPAPAVKRAVSSAQ